MRGYWTSLAVSVGTAITLHAGVPAAADDATGRADPLPPANQVVRADLVQELRLPGAADQFRRPCALFADRRAGEIVVGDESRGRIVIFDSHGVFRADFYGQGRFSSPRDVVVDSEGYIFILVGTRQGPQVLRYDFDGSFLSTFGVEDSLAGRPFAPAAMAIDGANSIYLRDLHDPRVGVWDRGGQLLRVIDLVPGFDAKQRDELFVGAMEIVGEELYVPLSSLGTVHVYDLEGNFLRGIGHQGSAPGLLSFPVDVAITSGGRVLVLDRNRFNVVCYGSDGKFRGEFGGKGISPGWFYRPSLLAVDENDQVYIGQIFMGRLQICRLPAFMAGGGPQEERSRTEAFVETSGKERDPRGEPPVDVDRDRSISSRNHEQSTYVAYRRLDVCLSS